MKEAEMQIGIERESFRILGNLFKKIYVQVVFAMIVGILLGFYAPELGEKMKPLADMFIRMIKLVVGPIVFCTLVTGISSMNDMKKTGRIGLKAIIYFEVATTLALAIGIIAVKVTQPGVGADIDINLLDASSIDAYRETAGKMGVAEYLMKIVPSNIFSPFTSGDMIQVVFLSVLFAFALNMAGKPVEPIKVAINQFSKIFFEIVHIIVKFAPIGAFGAMAFTVGKFGVGTLSSLWQLILTFYLTCFVFIFFVLGFFSRLVGVNLWSLIKYIKDEILIVFSASSSEAALPLLMEKMQKLGCKAEIVDLVVPTGYSFNLDGICIYMTLAAMFIAQALNIELTLTQELTLLAVTLITSKGAAGVTGSGFIVLASTLSVLNYIPVEGMVIILGIDRFMSEARAVTSFIGNSVATLVVSAWEDGIDRETLQRELSKV